jgi:hypothetical protein
MRSALPPANPLFHLQPLARAAYGVQVVAAMYFFGGLALLFLAVWAGVKVGILDGDALKGVAYWLGGWAAGLATMALSAGVALFAWRYSGDWVTEWPGYVTGVVAALLGLGLLFWLVFGTDLPLLLAALIPAGALFVFGFGVADRLGGQRAPSARPRPRAAARRR